MGAVLVARLVLGGEDDLLQLSDVRNTKPPGPYFCQFQSVVSDHRTKLFVVFSTTNSHGTENPSHHQKIETLWNLKLPGGHTTIFVRSLAKVCGVYQALYDESNDFRQDMGRIVPISPPITLIQSFMRQPKVMYVCCSPYHVSPPTAASRR